MVVATHLGRSAKDRRRIHVDHLTPPRGSAVAVRRRRKATGPWPRRFTGVLRKRKMNVCPVLAGGGRRRPWTGFESTMRETIAIRGAREHNLKNIDLDIPRNRLVVITGVSGSGKSTLAFDTLFAEGQRRYVESLSAYARQFLEQMDKPDVDTIEGLSPAISIEQKTTSKNPRSTVATVTEIYDYLRLLFASIGVAFCPDCDLPIQGQTIQQMVDRITGAAGRHALPAPRAAGRRQEGRAPQAVRADGARGLRARPRRRRAGRRREPARPRQEEEAHHRGRGRPPRGARRPRQPPRRLARDRAQGRRGRGAHRAARRRGVRALLAPLLPQLRLRPRRAVAAPVLVQLAAGRLPGVHRPRRRPGGRPGQARRRPRALARRRRARRRPGEAALVPLAAAPDPRRRR